MQRNPSLTTPAWRHLSATPVDPKGGLPLHFRTTFYLRTMGGRKFKVCLYLSWNPMIFFKKINYLCFSIYCFFTLIPNLFISMLQRRFIALYMQLFVLNLRSFCTILLFLSKHFILTEEVCFWSVQYVWSTFCLLNIEKKASPQRLVSIQRSFWLVSLFFSSSLKMAQIVWFVV